MIGELRDVGDISPIISDNQMMGPCPRREDGSLLPTARLLKRTFILHNLHAVIRLSLQNRPFIIQGGWISLGLGPF